MAQRSSKSHESLFKRLSTLFKSGPVVKRKVRGYDTVVAGPDKLSSSGVALFQKSTNPTYAHITGNAYNLSERLMRYQDFDSMEYTPELASALDIYCLAEDTVIPLLDGTKIRVKDLCEQNRTDFYVYSFDIENKRFVPGKCSKVLKTGVDQNVYRVKFDDGTYVRLTENHLVLLGDGTYKRVKELARFQQVRSTYITTPYTCVSDLKNLCHFVTDVSPDGSCDVYDLEVEEYHNFAIAGDKDTNSYIIVHNSDETCCSDDKGRILHVFSDNPRIKSTLDDLFYNILNFEFVGRSWARHLCKFGDLMLFIDVSPEYGVVNAFPIPINEIEREEGFDKDDPFAVRFRWLSLGNKPLDNWQVAHFRLLGSDMFLPYGSSIIEPARRIWRQLILCEDAMLVYRVVRAPERRVFYIDVGNLPPEAIPTYIEEAKKQLKTQPVTENNTGKVDIRYSPMSISEDYYIGVRGTETGTKIDTLAGGQNAAAIEDVNYLQRKLFAALKVPKAYLGYEDSLCLSGNTMIPLLSGKSIEIEKLSEECTADKEAFSKKHWVYSCDPTTGKIEPRRLLNAWKTKEVGKLLVVTLDDGTSVKCTHNHPFLCRDGSYARADELVPGQSLMPMYVRDSVSTAKGGTDLLQGYEMLHQNDGSGWQYTHKLVNESVTKGNHVIGKTRVIHHNDYDKRNNAPDNLVEMTWSEHRKLHRQNLESTLQRPDVIERREPVRIAALKSESHRQKKSVQMRQQHADESSLMSKWVHGDEIHTKMSEVMKRNWQDPRYRELKIAQIKEYACSSEALAKRSGKNHWIAKKYEQYDIEWLVKFCVDNNVTTLKQWDKNHPRSVAGFCEPGVGYVQSLLKRSSYGSWRCLYESRIKPLAENKLRNHKVLSVEELTLGSPIPVYDVEVEGLHNFAVQMTSAVNVSIDDRCSNSFVFVHNSSKSSLSQEDIRFSRTIAIIQKTMIAELNKIAIIHLFSHGFDGDDLLDFTLKFSNPSTIAQQQKLELWRSKFDIASTMPENVLSKKFVRQEIFGLNDEQCKKIDEQRMREVYVDAKIQAAGGEIESGGGGGGGGGAASLFGPPSEPSGGEEGFPEPSLEEPSTPEPTEEPEPEESEELVDDDEELLLASDDLGFNKKKPVKIASGISKAKYNQLRRSMYKAERRPSRDEMPNFSKSLMPNNDPYDTEHLHAVGTMQEIAPRVSLSVDTVKMLGRMSEALGMRQSVREPLITESSEDLGSIVIEEEE